MADKTLNCDESLMNHVIRDKIEKKNILHLRDGKNAAIYVFAMSLGVSRNKKVSSNKSVGYFRFSAAEDSKEMSYIYSVALNELRAEGKENQINDEDVVRRIVEPYVNGGLIILDEMIGDIDKFDEERFLYDIINVIDNFYYEVYDRQKLSLNAYPQVTGVIDEEKIVAEPGDNVDTM